MSQLGFQPVRIQAINGRNDADSPLDPDLQDLAQEAMNVDRFDGLIGRKRNGCNSVATTGGTAFTGMVAGLHRFNAGLTPTTIQLFGVDGTSGIVKRLAASSSWADVTLADALTGELNNTKSAILDGKLYFAGKTAQDRLHCYDPVLASPKIRRVGIAPGTNVPTVANFGAGAVTGARYYRVRWLQLNGTTIVRRSEPTPNSTLFTPSGAGSAARVTRPTAPGEDETHWEVEVSTDGLTFYRLFGSGGTTAGAAIAIATTTADDTTVATTTYPLYTLSDKTGTYALPWSARFLVSDGSRLVFAGDFSTTYSSSFGWTPVKGDLSAGDSERIVVTNKQRNYDSLGENDGDTVTGMAGPIMKGVIFIFKYSQIWQLTPTGDVLVPYLKRRITDQVGCIDHASITIGEDAEGDACIYFMSLAGPYRLGKNGLQYLGRDVEDILINSTGATTLNLEASVRICLSLWYKEKHQLWMWVTTGSNNSPTLKLVFDPKLGRPDVTGRIRRGWFVHDGPSAAAVSAAMMAQNLAASMSVNQKPYIGTATAATMLKCDASGLGDGGVAFQAYIKFRPITQSANLYPITGCSRIAMVGKPLSGQSLTLTLTRDFGKNTARTFSASLTASGSETRIIRDFPDSALTEAQVIELQVGDSAAVSSGSWVLDEIIVPVTINESKT